MGRFQGDELEKETVRTVAAMMAASARTAPKALGLDAVKTMVVNGDDLALLADAMEAKVTSEGPAASS
jgi:uncharacterized ferredoxin-like protein